MTTIEITTGARLHFGPLAVDGPSGGRFGGVGVMIESPRVALTARRSDRDSIIADTATTERAHEFLRRIRMADQRLPHCEITIHETVPSHLGLGSGTQLGLAIARAVVELAETPDTTMESLARLVGRGLRSAIGLHGFRQGGFLVDGGRVETDQIGTLVARSDFPAEWRFVLAIPDQTTGLSGAAEQSAFARQPSMPTSLSSELCRIVLMDWLPAVIEAEFGRSAEALFQYGQRVGEFFSPAQGGVFASRRMAEWAQVLRRRGVVGVAQSSWGPTAVAHCPNESEARQLLRDFGNDPAWRDCEFQIASPLNSGALVRRRPD